MFFILTVCAICSIILKTSWKFSKSNSKRQQDGSFRFARISTGTCRRLSRQALSRLYSNCLILLSTVRWQLEDITLVMKSYISWALLLGVFVVFNIFNAVLARRVREIALLRLLVFTRWRLCRLVFAETLLLGLFATIIGLISRPRIRLPLRPVER